MQTSLASGWPPHCLPTPQLSLMGGVSPTGWGNPPRLLMCRPRGRPEPGRGPRKWRVGRKWSVGFGCAPSQSDAKPAGWPPRARPAPPAPHGRPIRGMRGEERRGEKRRGVKKISEMCVLHRWGRTHGLALPLLVSASHGGFAPATGSGSSSGEFPGRVVSRPHAVARSYFAVWLAVWVAC